MAESDKKIYLRLELDKDKFRDARDSIVDLTQKVRELAQELNKISLGGGSLLGGASTNTKDAIPIPSAGNSGSGTTGIGGGGSGSNLTSGVNSMASGMKAIASEAISATKSMTSALREAVDQQTASLGKLKATYQELQNSFRPVGTPSMAEQLIAFDPFQAHAERGGNRGGLSQRFLRPPSVNESGFSSGSMAEQLRLNDPFQTRGGPTRGPSWYDGLGSTIANAREGGGFFGIPGSVIGAGIAGGLYLGRQFSRADIEHANESLLLGTDSLSIGSRIGGSIGNLGLSMRGGRNLAATASYFSLQRSGELEKAIYGETNPLAITHDVAGTAGHQNTHERTMARLKATSHLADNYEPSGDIDARGSLATEPGRLLLHTGDNINDVITDQVKNKIRRNQRTISADTAEAGAAAIQMDMQRELERSAALNFFQSNAPGALGRMVAAGMGPAKHVDPTTGEITYTDSTLGLGKNSPFSDDAVASAMGQLGLQAGRGVRGRAKGLMFKQAGGLSGANEIFAGALQYGGGEAYIRAISQASSSSPTYPFLDTSASNAIGGYMASTLQGGFGGTAGVGALQGALSITAGASTSVGEDMRNSRNFISGGAQYNNLFLRGGLDPLQQAINHYSSRNLGGSMYGRLAIERLTPTELAEYSRNPNGPIALSLQARGVTPQMVQQYAQNTASLLFARYSPRMGANTPSAQAVNAARSKGIVAYLQETVGNKTGEARAKALGQGIDVLASGLDDASGFGLGQENARGVIMNVASQDTTLAKTITGGHVGVGTGKAAEQKAKDEATKADQDLLHLASTKYAQQLNETLSKATGAGNQLVGLTGSLNTSVKKIVDTINLVTRAFEEKLLPALNRIGK